MSRSLDSIARSRARTFADGEPDASRRAWSHPAVRALPRRDARGEPSIRACSSTSQLTPSTSARQRKASATSCPRSRAAIARCAGVAVAGPNELRPSSPALSHVAVVLEERAGDRVALAVALAQPPHRGRRRRRANRSARRRARRAPLAAVQRRCRRSRWRSRAFMRATPSSRRKPVRKKRSPTASLRRTNHRRRKKRLRRHRPQ